MPCRRLHVALSVLVTLVLFTEMSFTMAAHAAKKPIVAVFAIQTKRIRLSADAKGALSAYLASRLTSSGAYQVVPRDQLKTALRKQKKTSYKRCYKQSCQIAVGQELSADKSLATEIMRIGKKCVVTVALYDLKKATTEKGADAEGGCSEGALMASIRGAVAKLAGAAAAQSRPTVPATGAPQSPVVPRRQGVAPPPPPDADSPDADSPDAGAAPSPRGPKIISIATLERLCSGGNGKACAKAAAYYYLGRGAPKNVPRAMHLNQLACKKGVAMACLFLGRAHKAGLGLPKDPRRAFAYTARACKLGHGDGCVDLAAMYAAGEGTAKRPTKAKALYRLHCARGKVWACNNLAMLLAQRNEHLDEALRVAVKAAEAKRSFMTFDTLAFVLLRRKAYEQAEAAILKAIAMAPKRGDLRRRLATIRAEARRAEQLQALRR